jgi:hypothetical protein
MIIAFQSQYKPGSERKRKSKVKNMLQRTQ